MKDGFLPIAAAFLAGVLAQPASALPPEPKNWEIQATLYSWAAGIHAEVETERVKTDIDESFFDILDDLGWAAMGGVEGRYERALVLVDFIGMQTATKADSSSRNFSFTGPEGRQGDLTIGPVETKTRLTEWMIDTKFGFRALTIPMAKLMGESEDPEDTRRLDFDLLAGIRIWDIEARTKIDLVPAAFRVDGTQVTLPGTLANLAFDLRGVRLPGAVVNGARREFEQDTSWVDPIVGFRVTADLTRRFSLFLLGDIGGWGIGSASDLTWQGFLGARFDWSEHWGVAGGFRALGVDRDSAIENTILWGPQVGVVFRY